MDLNFDDATQELPVRGARIPRREQERVPDEVLRHRRGLRTAPALGQGALRRRPVGDHVAREVRRAGRARYCSGSSTRRSTSAPAPRDGRAPTVPRCWRRRCSRTAPRSSSTGYCRKWPAARRSGRRHGQSRSPAATLRPCDRLRPGPTAAGYSTARRSGVRERRSASARSGCSARIPRRSGIRG